jgi:hypothetical protein
MTPRGRDISALRVCHASYAQWGTHHAVFSTGEPDRSFVTHRIHMTFERFKSSHEKTQLLVV